MADIEKKAPESTPRDLSVGSMDQALYVDPVAEKKLLRKLDIWLAPVATIIFLAAYLDRSNIGNAASAGMTADLGMTSDQYGSMLSTAAGCI